MRVVSSAALHSRTTSSRALSPPARHLVAAAGDGLADPMCFEVRGPATLPSVTWLAPATDVDRGSCVPSRR